MPNDKCSLKGKKVTTWTASKLAVKNVTTKYSVHTYFMTRMDYFDEICMILFYQPLTVSHQLSWARYQDFIPSPTQEI